MCVEGGILPGCMSVHHYMSGTLEARGEHQIPGNRVQWVVSHYVVEGIPSPLEATSTLTSEPLLQLLPWASLEHALLYKGR